jgi:tRNA pseudouridine13 synthase
MKLKQQPADFIVEEITDIPISSETKEHAIYLLEKQEIDTFEAINLISRQLNIPLFDIGYAGLKDKHAITKQYISIPSLYNVQPSKLTEVHLSFLGFLDRKIQIGDHLGNRFTITARNIQFGQLKEIQNRTKTVSVFGVPNYFDSQRFGSVINHEFIIKHIINKNFEQAVKQYLTAYIKSEPKRTKNIKRDILAHWDTLSTVSIREKKFAIVLHEYQRTQSWQKAYKKIPAHLREMYVNAYQSFLWNECIKEVLKKEIDRKKLYPVEYPLGSLLFYRDLTESEQKRLPPTFQTISEKAAFKENEEPIIHSILSKQNLSLKDFNIQSNTGNFFKTRERPTIVLPEQFVLSEPLKDELNGSPQQPRYKIALSFILTKGSYATLVTKKIFGH